MQPTRHSQSEPSAIVVDSVIDGIVAFETDYTGRAVRKLGYIWFDLSGMAHVTDAEGNEIATAYEAWDVVGGIKRV